MTAFVLGNGMSRANLDPSVLMQHGPVIGCNALYRTHTPTILVATDRNIAQDIQESGYSLKHRFYTRRPLPGLGALPVPTSWFGFSSGPIAVALAAESHWDPIYLVGFDMGPSPQGRFNNVYRDTKFYRASESPPIYTGNWVKQLLRIFKEFPDRRFYRVMGETTAVIAELHAPNLQSMPWADFVQRINTAKDL